MGLVGCAYVGFGCPDGLVWNTQAVVEAMRHCNAANPGIDMTDKFAVGVDDHNVRHGIFDLLSDFESTSLS